MDNRRFIFFLSLITVTTSITTERPTTTHNPVYSNAIDPPVISLLKGITSTSLLLKWNNLASVTVDWYEAQYAVNSDCSQALNFSAVESTTKNITGTETEFTLTNLQKWTCYEVRIRAAIKDSIGYTNFSASARNRTLEDAPTAGPLNIKVSNISSTSLDVTWEPPPQNETHGKIRQYSIKYRQDDCNSTSTNLKAWTYVSVNGTMRHKEITGLTKWSCYAVQILAVTIKNGTWTEEIQRRTSEDAPTAGPLHVKVANISSTSLDVTWDPPLQNETHGKIRQYSIRYRQDDCNSTSTNLKAWTHVSVNGTMRHKEITGLTKWSCYAVQILAVTIKDGIWTEEIQRRTSEDAPTAGPLHVKVANISSTSLDVTWEPPLQNETHGKIRQYSIRYRQDDCNSTSTNLKAWTYVSVNGTMRHKEVTGLTKWSCYAVQILAVTIKDGIWTEEIKRRTSEDAPSRPPNITSVYNISSVSLRVLWSPPPPEFQHGIIRTYEIQYRKVNCSSSTVFPYLVTSTKITKTVATVPTETTPSEGLTYRFSFNTGETTSFLNQPSDITWNITTVTSAHLNATLLRLSIWSCYSIKVIAITVGRSPESSAVTERTDESVPGRPTDVRVKNRTSSIVSVRWNKPETPNGIILGYRISYKLQYSNDTMTNVSLQPGSYFKNITQLGIYKWYQIVIAARTIKGYGIPVERFVHTDEDVPSRPQTVKFDNFTAFSIRISWTRPEFFHGIFLGYKVSYCEGRGSSCSNYTVIGISYSHNFAGLSPAMKYTFKVLGYTSKGNGPSINISETTDEYTPTPVRNLNVSGRTSNSISLSWLPPEKPNGNVSYKVFYRFDNQASSSDNFSRIIWNKQQYTVEDLHEFIWYIFTVQPFNKRGGDGEKRSVTAQTHPSAPTGPPLMVSARSLTSTSMLLTWKHPLFYERNGIITNYFIKYNITGETKNIITTTNRTHQLVENLEEFVIYSFQILARNAEGDGPVAIVVNRTLPDRPGNPTFDSCSNTSSTSIHLVWVAPKDPNGIVTHYRLNWTFIESFSTNWSRGGSEVFIDNQLNETVTRLEKFSNYNFTLEAKTVVGWGQSTLISCRTSDDAPYNAPSDINFNVTSTSITLTWKAPTRPNGIIRGYEVTYSSDPLKKNFFRGLTGKIVDLNPNTDYVFQVRCRSSGGLGPYNDVKVKTLKDNPPTVPTNPTTPTGKPIRHDTFTVPLWKGSDVNGKIRYYCVVVMELEVGTDGTPITPSKSPEDYSTNELKINHTYKDYVEKRNTKRNLIPYIAGYFTTIPPDRSFIVGNGTKSQARKRKRRNTITEYFNGPLFAKTSYSVFQRAFVTDTLYISSPTWMGPWITGASPTSAPKPKSIVGAIVGGIIGFLLAACVALALLFFYRRRQQSEPGNKRRTSSIKMNRRGSQNHGFRDEYQDSRTADYRPPSQSVRVESFDQYYQQLNRDSQKSFAEEFKLIRNGPNSVAEHTIHPINRDKNRYTNIVAYDHTRVLLNRVDNIPEGDYINANYIDGFGKASSYIAAQGPLENTCEDFWRMVWEQDVPIIIMLTRCVESGKIKCSKYWPDAGSSNFGEMQVSISESSEFPDYNVKVFSLLNNREPGQEKFVKHFHFLAWPDHGVPSSENMLAFIRRVNSATPSGEGPSLVHCSAGVGRTGSYIVVDVNIKRMAAEGRVEIYHYLQHIRTQRNFMVQTEGQYIFIHEALREFIKCGVTEIMVKDIRDYTKRLQKQIGGSQELGVDREFNRLNEFAQSVDQTLRAANAMVNKRKNRFFNILPYDDTRVQLRIIAGVPGSDYINANFIDGYFYPKAFIATQAPLRDTMGDFWRMIWEQGCMTVVCLILEGENTKTKFQPYWPVGGNLKFHPVIVEKGTENVYQDFICREFKMTHAQEARSRTIRHFQLTSWPDNGMPENGGGLVDLIGQVQKWQLQTGNNVITVHCSTGVGRTGVFIALNNLIERVKVEGVIDIFQTVRKLRTQRPAMVQTKGQYLFCYIALQDYLASFDFA